MYSLDNVLGAGAADPTASVGLCFPQPTMWQASLRGVVVDVLLDGLLLWTDRFTPESAEAKLPSLPHPLRVTVGAADVGFVVNVASTVDASQDEDEEVNDAWASNDNQALAQGIAKYTVKVPPPTIRWATCSPALVARSIATGHSMD